MLFRKQRLDWRYGITELVIVVAGVLIALAADGWSKRQADRALELRYLNDLVVDLKSDTAQLRAAIDLAETRAAFGHAVLRAEDPRATIEYELGKEIAADNELFKTALAMREIGVEILSGIDKISNPYPNVDAVSGSLLHACGLTDSDFYTVLFGLSRCTGIAAQVIDERVRARGGKGVPLTRPKFLAEDQPPRHVEG